jgi:hypothetical protein
MNDLKDRTPNPETIAQAESLLRDAKEGKVRTLFYITGWEDDSFSCGWSLDKRNTQLRFIGRLNLAKAEIESAYILRDESTELSQAIRGWR